MIQINLYDLSSFSYFYCLPPLFHTSILHSPEYIRLRASLVYERPEYVYVCQRGGGDSLKSWMRGGKGARGTGRGGRGGPTLPGERQFHSWFAP